MTDHATTEDCVEVTIQHPAQGEPTIWVENPDYIPATEGHFEEVENPDYVPAVEGYYETVENPDYVPATEPTTVLDGYMKWNWTGGKINYTPAAPGGTDDWGWHQVGMTNDSKAGTPDVVHKGKGKSSFFYYESVYVEVPGEPAQGEPTIEVWVEGTPAVGEPRISEWVEGTEAVGEPLIEIANPDYVEAWEETFCEVTDSPTPEQPVTPPPAEETGGQVALPAKGKVNASEAIFEPITLETPEQVNTIAEVQEAHQVPELAETGSDFMLPLTLGVALTAAAVTLLWRKKA